MARQRVEVVKCDRCKREELQPVPDVAKTEPDLHLKFMGEEVVYTDLCPECERTTKNMIKDLKEWNRKINSLLDGPPAPPIQVAPNYTPPKPHSPGAAKK